MYVDPGRSGIAFSSVTCPKDLFFSIFTSPFESQSAFKCFKTKVRTTSEKQEKKKESLGEKNDRGVETESMNKGKAQFEGS